MNRRCVCQGWPVYGLFGMLAVSPVGAKGQDGAPDIGRLVRGIVARSDALVSGRLEYDLSYGPPGATLSTQHAHLSVSGASWALRRPKTEGYHVNHGGKHVYYHRTPQPDGSIRDNAEVTLDEPIDKRYPSPPVFAGTFWWKSTTEYVKANPDKAVYAGRKSVNGVDAHVLEWRVPRNKLAAFGTFGPATQNGGTLRVAVAPQFGYVLPRVECVGPDGALDIEYNCFEFIDTGGGLYLPARCVETSFRGDRPTFQCEYKITKAERINDVIPPEDFVLELPKGTLVQDGREPGNGVSRTVGGSRQLPADLSDIIDAPSPPWWRNWKWAVAAGVGLGAVLAVLTAYWFRRRRRRAA
jgi:hypothetical protein